MTKEQIKAVIEVTVAIGNTIRELGSVPSGHLYARVCGSMSLENYNAIIAMLKRNGMVSEQAHLLTWIGPKKES